MHHLFIHQVQVSTCTKTFVGGRPVETWSISYATVRCRLEPEKPTVRTVMLGRVQQQIWRITWANQAIKNGDRVTFTGPISAASVLGIPIGMTFTAREPRNMTMMALGPTNRYQTAELWENK